MLTFYQDQGYTLLNVFEAAEVARDYDMSMDEAFALFHDRGGYRQVKRYLEQGKEVAAYVPTDRCTFGGWLDEDGQTLNANPKTGTNVAEICTWVAKGYKLEDVDTAFAFSEHFQMTVAELLALHEQKKDWDTVSKGLPFTEHMVVEITGLEVDKIRSLVNQGFTHNDLVTAFEWSKQRYQTTEEVLTEFDEKGRDWKAYETNNPTPGDVVVSIGMPLEKVLALRSKGAKTLWILIAYSAAKTEGLAFDVVIDDMIKHNGHRTIIDYEKNAKLPEKDSQSYEELRKLLGLPASTQVSFETGVLNKLLDMGYYGEESAKVGLIAKAFHLSALEVAAMKKPEMSWLDLIDQLKK